MTAPTAEVIADASALLAIVSALPVEPPEVRSVFAPDSALTDVIAVLRSFHGGRPSDVLGDVAVIGIHVHQWLPTFRFATTLAGLALDHPDESVSDLVAIATARALDLPLVTGLAHLATLDPGAEVIVLPRRDVSN